MALLTSALAALLILTGLGALAMSVDLIPTEVGLFYGVSGVILVSCGAIVLAVALLIAKLDRIVAPKPEPAFEAAPSPEPTPEAASSPEPGRHEVGRYAAGAKDYAIFSDGSIEANTEQGRMRFQSMAEFRAHVEAQGAGAE